ncbi:hypothetical protein BDY19DRAFT_988770 [Irpex rosettiformis]|uniref:Uncharacterized protein n=1 Tax=Irpex rosettiformis TaxID=378272 RepID=A0ACB8UKW7_9APHY|nr:hypothetical protein BDY19DRAFT_988770 [Irpex rosettiformis]
MSATTATRPPAGQTRRSTNTVSGTGTTSTAGLPRGATARAAVSPRLTSSLSVPGARRGSIIKSVAPPPPPVVPEGSKEALAASLKAETEEKEKLLLQLQDKEQTISSLKTDNDGLKSSLHAAETRLGELYADQTRMEEEMSARIEVIEKLRSQVRELEKEKRDSQRRYNEQTASFEAERQAFYDNEQHLKSRIQSLSQARKQPPQSMPSAPSVVSLVESEADAEPEQESQAAQDVNDPEQEPAEMTALRLELSTLSISHASLQSTLHLLQSQLNDLKRVNNELQEENESYNILLREKTLTGQFDVLRMGGASISEVDDESARGSDDGSESGRDADSLASKGTSRSVLDPVHELAEELENDQQEQPEMDPQFQQSEPDEQDENEPSGRRTRHGRKRSSVIVSRGESLANLPITGPGLDLAAELGRAENKDILDTRTSLDDRTNVDTKQRKSKKAVGGETSRKVSTVSDSGLEPSASSVTDIDALRNEVKSLKDANKALSLYASKIIDRIISQEGFEHVLAIDWDKQPTSPASATVAPATSSKSPEVSATPKKARPQTMMFSRSTPSTSTNTPVIAPTEKLTTFESLRAAQPPPPPPTTQTKPPAGRASRRSMSFDWRSFSMFSGAEKKVETIPNLRPLTLKAGTTSVVTNARKLDTQEDEEDRRERERLHATMKLMGIEKPNTPPSPLPPLLKSFSTPGTTGAPTTDSPPLSAVTGTPTTAVASRFSFFRRSSSVRGSETSSVNSSQGQSRSQAGTPHLTQEALEQADAEASLAALDAHERQLSAEMAKGAGGGFTEIVRRSGDRRSSRRSGSGSTVFSAGLSTRGDED